VYIFDREPILGYRTQPCSNLYKRAIVHVVLYWYITFTHGATCVIRCILDVFTQSHHVNSITIFSTCIWLSIYICNTFNSTT